VAIVAEVSPVSDIASGVEFGAGGYLVLAAGLVALVAAVLLAVPQRTGAAATGNPWTGSYPPPGPGHPPGPGAPQPGGGTAVEPAAAPVTPRVAPSPVLAGPRPAPGWGAPGHG
jgi:hypothetical protein